MNNNNIAKIKQRRFSSKITKIAIKILQDKQYVWPKLVKQIS